MLYRKTFGIQFIKKVININTYEIYCGNHLHALVMINFKQFSIFDIR